MDGLYALRANRCFFLKCFLMHKNSEKIYTEEKIIKPDKGYIFTLLQMF